MKNLMLLLLFSSSYFALAQDVPFKNKSLLTLPLVEQLEYEYPFSIPNFYSLKDYAKLEYNGIYNEQELKAHRTWQEETFSGDIISYQEVINVNYGNSGDEYRNIRQAKYTRWASYTKCDGEIIDFSEYWKEQEVKIDYIKNTLFCTYKNSIEDSSLCLKTVNPLIEDIKSLRDLSYFYRNKNQLNTVFSIKKIQEEIDTSHIKVNNLEGILKNLKNNSFIELKPGMYNISKLDTSKSGKFFKWSYYIEGEDYAWGKTMLIFRDMENISIKGIGNNPSDFQVYTEDSDAIVLIFENCKNVNINNIWFGHKTQSESCFGGVLSFINCNNININNTQMYGTGYYGFEIYNAKKLWCSNSEIWDCSGGAFHIAGCDTAKIVHCNIHDNASTSHFSSLSDCKFIEIKNSIWSENKIDDTAVENQAIFSLWNSNLTVRDSKFSNNHIESFIKRKETDSYSFENVDTNNNIIIKEFEAIDED